jgi:hypothetical protein
MFALRPHFPRDLRALLVLGRWAALRRSVEPREEGYRAATGVPGQRESHRQHHPRVPACERLEGSANPPAVRRCRPVVVHGDPEDPGTGSTTERVVDHRLDDLGESRQQKLQQALAEQVRAPAGAREETVEAGMMLRADHATRNDDSTDPASRPAENPPRDECEKVLEAGPRKAASEGVQ